MNIEILRIACRNSTFNCALTISLSFWTRNLYKSLQYITKLPYILCAVASLHVQLIRRFVLRSTIVRSIYVQSKSIELIKNWIFFNISFQRAYRVLFRCLSKQSSYCAIGLVEKYPPLWIGVTVDVGPKILWLGRWSKDKDHQISTRLIPSNKTNCNLFARYSTFISFSVFNNLYFHWIYQMKSRMEHFVDIQLKIPIEKILLFKNLT